MPSKYCPVCNDLVTCSSIPNYCGWCGYDLRNQECVPAFNTYQERLKVIAAVAEKLKKQKPATTEISPGVLQTKLF